jgi:hypothetical protein
VQAAVTALIVSLLRLAPEEAITLPHAAVARPHKVDKEVAVLAYALAAVLCHCAAGASQAEHAAFLAATVLEHGTQAVDMVVHHAVATHRFPMGAPGQGTAATLARAAAELTLHTASVAGLGHVQIQHNRSVPAPPDPLEAS